MAAALPQFSFAVESEVIIAPGLAARKITAASPLQEGR